MKKLSKVLALIFLWALPALANVWFVSPTGAPTNSGTQASPWDFTSAFSPKPQIQPGDVVCMEPGTYKNTGDEIISYISGSAAAPVIITNWMPGTPCVFPGGGASRVTLDGAGGEFALSINGSYSIWWGIEITTSQVNRQGGTDDICPTAWGIADYGIGTKVINSIVHDTCEGFSIYNKSINGEYVGNNSFYNGWHGPDRNHGHGFYMQNPAGSIKTLIDNISHDNFDEGYQIYGSGAATVQFFDLEWNTAFMNSDIIEIHPQYQILLAGGGPRSNNTLNHNFSYLPLNWGYGFNNFGQYTAGTNDKYTNNVVVGGLVTQDVAGEGGTVVFTGNTFVNTPAAEQFGTPLFLLKQAQFVTQNDSQFTWDNNTYIGFNSFYGPEATYGTDSSGNSVETGSTQKTFAQWQASWPFDQHSTYTDTLPTTDWIYIHANKYETKRANINIFHWAPGNTVSVDLSSILSNGDPYTIINSEDPYGPPAASGTYSGPVTIDFSMKTKAAPHGATTPPIDNKFGAFIVTSSNGTKITTFAPPPPTSLAITTGGLSAATLNAPYTVNLSATGGTSPYTWTVTGLPTGLSFSGNTISGTPTAVGVTTVAVSVTDSASPPAKVATTFSLVVSQPQGFGFTVGQVIEVKPTLGGPLNVRATPDTTTAPICSSAAPVTCPQPSDQGVITIAPQTDPSTGFPIAQIKWTTGVATGLTGWSVSLYIDVPAGPPPPPAPLAINTATLPTASVGVVYSATLAGSGGTTPYTWTATGVPSPLALSTAGVLSGTPTTAGTSSIAVTVTDSSTPTHQTATATLVLTTNPFTAPPVAITTTSLPAGTQNVPYNATVGASGGTAPYTFSATNMPPGLSISTGGNITGTPTSSGVVSVNFAVTDSATPTAGMATTTLSITINPPAPPPSTISFVSAKSGADGSGSTLTTIATSSTMNIAAGNLLVCGTKTSTAPSSVTDGGSNSLTLINTSGPINTWQKMNTSANATATITASGFSSAYPAIICQQYSGVKTSAAIDIQTTGTSSGSTTVTSSAFTRAVNNEVITAFGNSNQNESFSAGVNYALRAQAIASAIGSEGGEDRLVNSTPASETASMSGNASGNWNLVVDSFEAVTGGPTLPSITTTSIPSGTVGVAYSQTLAGTGGTPPYTWSATGMPSGVTLSSGGAFSGTPTQSGTFTIPVTLKDSSTPQLTAGATFSLSVVAKLQITTSTLNQPQETVPYSSTVSAVGGTLPYTWSATGLPTNLSISIQTGVISGIPLASTNGNITVTVTVTDANSLTASQNFTVNIPAALSSIANIAIVPANVTMQVGQQVQFAVQIQCAPAGSTCDQTVNWSAGTGTISTTGLYTALGTPGSDTVTVTSNSDTTKTATATVTIVTPPPPASAPPGILLGLKYCWPLDTNQVALLFGMIPVGLFFCLK